MEGKTDKELSQKVEERLREHFNHPFYRHARNFWAGIQRGQIAKGAEKYEEPFTPDSWTNKELVTHFMQENVDQAHYGYALYERCEKLEEEKKAAIRENIRLRKEVTRLRDLMGLRAPKPTPGARGYSE